MQLIFCLLYEASQVCISDEPLHTRIIQHSSLLLTVLLTTFLEVLLQVAAVLHLFRAILA